MSFHKVLTISFCYLTKNVNIDIKVNTAILFTFLDYISNFFFIIKISPNCDVLTGKCFFEKQLPVLLYYFILVQKSSKTNSHFV